MPLPILLPLFLALSANLAQAKTFRCDSIKQMEDLQLTMRFQPNEKEGILELKYLGTDPATLLVHGRFRIQQTEKNAILNSEIVGKYNYQVKLLLPKEYRAKNILSPKMKLSRTSTAPIYSQLDCRTIK